MHQFNLDFEEAMKWVVAYHVEVERKFLDGLKRVPSFGPKLDEQVQKYLQGLANWPRGNDCWTFESRRYFGSHGGEVKRTRLVPLYPKQQSSDKILSVLPEFRTE